MSDREQLLHLVDRARRGVALPAELDALAAGITELANRAEQAEAALEQAELDAEQQARHFRTVCGERESYRQAWKYEQKRRATAEAAINRVRQMTDAWEQQLPDVIRTPAVVSALRAATDQPQQPTTTEA